MRYCLKELVENAASMADELTARGAVSYTHLDVYKRQVYARSGLSIKHGLCMANGVGVVDSDYRGELKVPMINLGTCLLYTSRCV